MPKAEDTHVIVELTHHSLHALRAVNGKIEAGGECLLENKSAVSALLASVSPDGWAEGLVAEAFIWPDDAGWRISTDTEAMLDRTGEALIAIASRDLRNDKEPFAYAVCNADDGRPVTPEGMENWVLAFSSSDSLGRVAENLSDLKIESDGAGPAGFARIGAIAAALRLEGNGSVALWDLGMDRSHVLLITPKGIENAVPCEVGLDGIFEAVQTALRLKFRGAGERLFFNESYDFTEAGPKIGSIVGAAIKQALGLLAPPESPPALACLGLTGRQGWFIREVAAAAGTLPWLPDLGKLAGELGVSFADTALETSFSPMSVGLFEHLSIRLRSLEAWSPAWVEAEAPVEDILPAPVPVPEPEPIREPEVIREPEPVRLPEPIREPEPLRMPEPVRLPDPAPEPPPPVRPNVPPPRSKPSLSTLSSTPPPPFPVRSSRPSVPPRPVPSPAQSLPPRRPRLRRLRRRLRRLRLPQRTPIPPSGLLRHPRRRGIRCLRWRRPRFPSHRRPPTFRRRLPSQIPSPRRPRIPPPTSCACRRCTRPNPRPRRPRVRRPRSGCRLLPSFHRPSGSRRPCDR